MAEWFPQMATLVTEDTGTPALRASWPLARFSSRRVMANQRSPGTSGALERAIRQLVLQGLPTTSTRTSRGRVGGDGPALRAEDPPVDGEQVAPLHARLAGDRADQQRPGGAVEGGVQVGGGHDVADQGKGAVVDLHDHALERLHARLDLEEAQHHRLVGAEQLARGDAEQEGVADLACGPGDGDVDGRFGCHGAEANRTRSAGSNRRTRRRGSRRANLLA